MPRAVYATANVSDGHVNPAVTLANCLTGHISWARGGLYMLAQLLGGIFGALLEVREQLDPVHCSTALKSWSEQPHGGLVQSGLLPNTTVGGGAAMPGCFTHLKGIQTTTTQLWWCETIMTFFLVMVRLHLLSTSCPGCAYPKQGKT